MSKELVKRLRKRWFTHGCEQYQLEAADEIERLNRVIDETAQHWLALDVIPPVPFEGGIDGAMLAACNEIRRLRKALGERWDYDG